MKLEKVIKNLRNNIGTDAIRFDEDGIMYRVFVDDISGLIEFWVLKNGVLTFDDSGTYFLNEWELQYNEIYSK